MRNLVLPVELNRKRNGVPVRWKTAMLLLLLVGYGCNQEKTRAEIDAELQRECIAKHVQLITDGDYYCSNGILLSLEKGKTI